jgi:hypothetical protein
LRVVVGRRLHHFVQTGCLIGGRLEPGPLRPFATAVAAEAAGQAWAERVDVVVVYMIEGDPECGDWGEPEILASYGAAPAPGEALAA